jgi:hypothetical protein
LTCFFVQIAFNVHAGDLIVWNARAIHKIDGPSSKDWGTRKRRVLGGTGVKAGAKYWGETRALFSDMSTHALKDGDPLVPPIPLLFFNTQTYYEHATSQSF